MHFTLSPAPNLQCFQLGDLSSVLEICSPHPQSDLQVAEWEQMMQ